MLLIAQELSKPFWPALVLPLVVIAGAALMIVLHILAWRRYREADISAGELRFRRNQFRRRLQTSIMLAVIGLAMIAGLVMLRYRLGGPWIIVIYWSLVLVLVLWLVALAVADMVATRVYFGNLRRDYLTEEARLQALLRKAQKERDQKDAGSGNGKEPHE